MGVYGMLSDGIGSYGDEFRAGLNVCLHFLVLGIIAVGTGRPFLFPSLGPSAYLLATGEQPREEGAYHVIGGHAVAVAAGMLAYALFGREASAYIAFDAPDPRFSEDLIALAASSTTAMVGTTIVMLITRTNHPAACATTLIIALGLMGGIADAIVILLAVTVLVFFHETFLLPLARYYGFNPDEARE